jgi:aspartate kinase
MTYYGATVIHPKTIRPLKINNIPLFVKPFMAPTESGTVIKAEVNTATLAPAIIVKTSQVLLSLSAKDYSFITEDHLSDIFKAFATAGLKVNMIQNSAITFSGCLDFDEERFAKLQQTLQNEYTVRFNTGLHLITIRHFKKEVIDELTLGKTILMEQFSRNTAQLVLKD